MGTHIKNVLTLIWLPTIHCLQGISLMSSCFSPSWMLPGNFIGSTNPSDHNTDSNLESCESARSYNQSNDENTGSNINSHPIIIENSPQKPKGTFIASPTLLRADAASFIPRSIGKTMVECDNKKSPRKRVIEGEIDKMKYNIILSNVQS